MTRLLQGTGISTGLLVSPGAIRLIHLPPGEAAGHATFPVPEMLAVRGRPMLEHVRFKWRRILSS